MPEAAYDDEARGLVLFRDEVPDTVTVKVACYERLLRPPIGG